ncbi:MAG: hypothetical protein R6V05_07410, partial [Candidatus Brocadiia bacterium]
YPLVCGLPPAATRKLDMAHLPGNHCSRELKAQVIPGENQMTLNGPACAAGAVSGSIPSILYILSPVVAVRRRVIQFSD